MNFKSFIQNPVHIFALLLVVFSLYKTLPNDGFNHIIRSDGNGYYAYLPALFIFNDGTFAASSHAEQTDAYWKPSNLYLSKDLDGNTYNKYFPGVAVMQTPFFLLGHLTAWLTSSEMNGYSTPYHVWFYIGSLFYVLLGLYLFKRLFTQLFPDLFPRYNWIFPLLYVATPLFFYTVATPSYSHLFSFFLFAAFGNSLLAIMEKPSTKRALLFGAVLGLIAITRPTNIVVIIAIPIILGSWDATKQFLQQLIAKKGRLFFLSLVGFLAVISLLFASWKWQTGHWLVWSYSGEGFNFFHPEWWNTWFSFRIGLFLHTPLMILVLVGTFYLIKKRFTPGFFWLLYFAINTWIIAAWWCWDFESPFGNRPFTEHLIFLLIPFGILLQQYRKWALIGLSVAALLGVIRLTQYYSGSMVNQRFTASSYFESLVFWNSSNYDRWNYTLSCPPHGAKIAEEVLVNEPSEKLITPTNEYFYTAKFVCDTNRVNERYYYVVELDKTVDYNSFDNVMLVIDAVDHATQQRYYKTVRLFNDRLEGKDDWVHLRFEGIVHDQMKIYDEITIYFWNMNPYNFRLCNVKVTVETYKD